MIQENVINPNTNHFPKWVCCITCITFLIIGCSFRSKMGTEKHYVVQSVRKTKQRKNSCISIKESLFLRMFVCIHHIIDHCCSFDLLDRQWKQSRTNQYVKSLVTFSSTYRNICYPLLGTRRIHCSTRN